MPGLPSTHTEPMGGPPGRGLLMRLHRDRRGLASIEFVLAAPVILLIVIFVIHANKISTKKVGTMLAMRNAAFAEANGLDCTSDFSNVFPIPALPAPPGATPSTARAHHRMKAMATPCAPLSGTMFKIP